MPEVLEAIKFFGGISLQFVCLVLKLPMSCYF